MPDNATQTGRPERPGRNDPCHCGSGKKYKKCHLERDEIEDRKRAQAEAAAMQASQSTEVKKEDKHNLSEQMKAKRPAPAPVKNTFVKSMFKRKTGES